MFWRKVRGNNYNKNFCHIWNLLPQDVGEANHLTGFLVVMYVVTLDGRSSIQDKMTKAVNSHVSGLINRVRMKLFPHYIIQWLSALWDFKTS